MALTINEIRVKIVDAYQRAIKATDEVVGSARAAVQLDDDLKRVIKIFHENRETLTKNLNKLTHTELMALAYIAPELTQFILDYEQEALAEDFEIATKEFADKPENDLQKQNVKKDFADTLELLQKLSEKHADDLVLTEKILDVSNSFPFENGKCTTRTLFEFYYVGPMETDQTHERKATITKKANKDLAYLASRSDLAAVILEEPLYISMVRNAAATDVNLNDALVSHIRKNNTEKALKFAMEVITTDALCKMMKPKIGEWLAYKFWFGSHPSEKITTEDLINRLLAYKEGDESALDKNLIEALLAKKLLGREYWREIDAEQWKIILKFLSDKVGLKEGDVYLRLAHERCSQALGDVHYKALKLALPQIPVPNTPGLQKLNALGIYTPTPGRNRSASIAGMSSIASVAPMSSGEKSSGLRRTQSVAEMASHSQVDVAAVDLLLTPIAKKPGDNFRLSTPVAAASNPSVVQSLRENFEALVGGKKGELSVADMNMNASEAAPSIAPMSGGPGSVAGMSSENSVASLGSSVNKDVQPPRGKSPSPTRQQRLAAMLEEEAAVAVSVAGMSSVSSPLTSDVVARAKANSSVAAMPEGHKEPEQTAAESSLVTMSPSPGSPRPS